MSAQPRPLSGIRESWRCLWVSLLVYAVWTIQLMSGRPTILAQVNPGQEMLRVVSAASHLTQEGCQYLLASAAHNGIDLHLIGYKDRAITNALVGSSKTSVKLIAAYQLAQTLPKAELLMLVDAFDVVIQGSVSDILAEYEALGSPGILFSSEANCWPPTLDTEGYCELASVYSNATSRFLNSGGVIGRAGELATLWKTLIKQEKAYYKKFSSKGQYWDDQGTVALSYLIGNPYNITLDVDSKIFFSTNDAMPDFGQDGKLGFKDDGRSDVPKHAPAVMHFNGYAKAALWEHNAWFQKHMPMQDISQLSFRINTAGKRRLWSELCGNFEIL